ncbi:MAG: DNA-binding protein [Bacteroidetes bacterium]|nr:MAG: DNA-binding protein [Bacteroidota bacterium]
MATNIITSEDLEQFKWELLDLIKEHLDKRLEKSKDPEDRQWLKSHQVQRMLGIAPNTLSTLRINGTLPYTKVGGTIFYDKNDIDRILEENKRNRTDY